MSNRHAYLILAHNEFEVLKVLISLLDDERNDLYIHLDRKVKDIPVLKTSKSKLYILTNRINIRWGHISQIQAEIELLKQSISNNKYSRYNIISGTHLPLVSQDMIHEYFNSNIGKEIFIPIAYSEDETYEKMKLYNLFMKSFIHSNRIVSIYSQKVWGLLLRIQKWLSISRNTDLVFKKASNWVSISHNAAVYLVKRQQDIIRRYNYTMCGDEYFIPTELNSEADLFEIRYNSNLLKQEFSGAHAKTFTMNDWDKLQDCDCLFARKFSNSDRDLLNKIIDKVNS